MGTAHTHRHTDTQTHRHTDTQTHRHTDTQTHRHTGTQTHRHTGTQTHRHTDTHTHTHTHTHTKASRGLDKAAPHWRYSWVRCRDLIAQIWIWRFQTLSTFHVLPSWFPAGASSLLSADDLQEDRDRSAWRKRSAIIVVVAEV